MIKQSVFRILIVSFMLAGSGVGITAESDNDFDAQQEAQRMQQHWDRLMHEQDAQKRRQLIREHREMMNEALEESGVDRFHMGMMHGRNRGHMDHHQDHLLNTIEMHHMQLDMMEE